MSLRPGQPLEDTNSLTHRRAPLLGTHKSAKINAMPQSHDNPEMTPNLKSAPDSIGGYRFFRES